MKYETVRGCPSSEELYGLSGVRYVRKNVRCIQGISQGRESGNGTETVHLNVKKHCL